MCSNNDNLFVKYQNLLQPVLCLHWHETVMQDDDAAQMDASIFNTFIFEPSTIFPSLFGIMRIIT